MTENTDKSIACGLCVKYEDMIGTETADVGFCECYWAIITNYKPCKWCEMDGLKYATEYKGMG